MTDSAPGAVPLACPFCGIVTPVEERSGGLGSYRVVVHPATDYPDCPLSDTEYFLDNWNRRAVPVSSPPAKVEERAFVLDKRKQVIAAYRRDCEKALKNGSGFTFEQEQGGRYALLWYFDHLSEFADAGADAPHPLRGKRCKACAALPVDQACVDCSFDDDPEPVPEPRSDGALLREAQDGYRFVAQWVHELLMARHAVHKRHGDFRNCDVDYCKEFSALYERLRAAASAPAPASAERERAFEEAAKIIERRACGKCIHERCIAWRDGAAALRQKAKEGA